ncbi:MAG TPA: hypothetical protein VFW09_01190 [Solirubrobacteraceae bacterium]|jgi:hypothetical protein|nr:hypothetical protein [Solirubrobacteraceae bacterium]
MAPKLRREIRDRTDSSRARPLGAERPGAALRGPLLTITCTCGRKQQLRFGDQWTCEDCGRVWDTNRLPRDEYEAIRRLQLRYRMLPVLFGLVVVGLAALFTLTGNAGAVVLLLPLALICWFTFLRNAHRRRFRDKVATRRREWRLRGEQ